MLAYAGEEAERLAHKHIGTEHLLLGLLQEKKCFAAQILMELGVRLSQIREEPHGSRTRRRMSQDGQRCSMNSILISAIYWTKLSRWSAARMNAIGSSSSYAASLGRIPCWSENRASAREPIVGGLARRIADGNVPQSLAEKAILALDLPPLRALEKDRSWQERLDRALLAAAEDGKVFFVNRMHDRPGGVSPIASIHVTELLQRPIIAGKIQCIGTSTPANFAKLRADGHWLAEYFEPIEVSPAN